MRWRVLLAVALVLFVAVGSGVVLAQEGSPTFRGEPNLQVFAPEPELTPGTTSTLELQVANEGRIHSGQPADRSVVTTARDVKVEVDERRAPISVETGRQSVGSIGEDEPRSVPIRITVPEDAEPGTYDVTVQLRYRYTAYVSQGNWQDERRATRTRTVQVEIDDGARFSLRPLDSDVQVGDSGTFRAELENVGGEPAREIDVALEATSPAVSFRGGERDTSRVDALAPGETETVEYDLAVRSNASVRNYSLTGEASFTDPDGDRTVDEQVSTTVRPLAEQSFAVNVEESTLRVGETGVVTGTVRNVGPASVEGVELGLEEVGFEPRSRTYAVGDLDVGETETFRFRGTVPPEGDAVPQRIDVTTRYVSPRGTDRVTTEQVRVDVAERRDAIVVEAVDPRFAAGEDGTLELDVHNQRDVEVREVRIRLDVEDPLESDFRSTVVSSLDPGETDRVAFDLEVDSDAPVSQYPATVEIEYLDPDDETVAVRPATIAVEVTEADGELFTAVELLIFGVMVVLLVAVFVWLYRT